MKKRSALDWTLIAVLLLLLLGAVIGFTFLLQMYLSPAATSPVTPQPATETINNPLVIEQSPEFTGMTIESPTPQEPSPEATGTPAEQTPSPTDFSIDLTGSTPAIYPNHFLFGRPLDASAPIWPVPDLRFGSGTNFSSRSGTHTGLDFLADYGAPVHAIGAGEVIWEGYGIESDLGPDNAYGVAITVKHDATVNDMSVYSIYAHLSVTHVVIGDRVNEGDLIAEVGLTGNTSGPHLHLEVRLGDDSYFVTRNPLLFIRPLAGHGLLAAHLFNTNGSNLYNQEVYLESLTDHKTWVVPSYFDSHATPDDELRENLVVGDLPAGQYAVIIYYGGAELHHSVIIHPGQITYFTFNGLAGYQDSLPE
jgi:murein DD-endopeptidase MepM/ murein hydrolase activator NlpD